MAGRHGNKGIVSRVVRQEDMPFLADGTRLTLFESVGRAFSYEHWSDFEAVLGRAGKNFGREFATPIFDGATMEDLDEWTDKGRTARYCQNLSL